MNLLFVTQSYDADSTILGVTADWVHALARRCSSVHVLAQRAGRRPPNAPANVTVHSLGKERGAARHRQLGRLLATLGHVLLNAPPAERATAIFVHMVPRYAALAAPLAKLRRIPLVLWYAQGGVSRDLHIAHRLVDRVVSASRRSYPLGADRLAVVGHGIDTDRYVPLPSLRRHGDGLLLLSVGRLSPAKDHETTIEALAVLHARAGIAAPPILRICGAPLYPSDEAYMERLRRRVAELGLEQAVQFAGNVPYAAMPAEYRRAAVCLHTSRTGSLDKAALEPAGLRGAGREQQSGRTARVGGVGRAPVPSRRVTRPDSPSVCRAYWLGRRASGQRRRRPCASWWCSGTAWSSGRIG